MNIEQAKVIIEKKHPESRVISGMDFPDKFVFSIVPKKEKDASRLMDPFFSVDKKTGKVSEFSPIMDIENFRKNIKNPVMFNR